VALDQVCPEESGESLRKELEVKNVQMGNAAKQDVTLLKCLLCGELQHHPIFNEFGIDILRCCKCRHIFSSFAADPHYDKFWGEEVAGGEHFYWSKARGRMHHDFFKRFVFGRSGRLLDMGCGLGFFPKAMAAYASWEAYGCEISPAAVRYARETLGLNNIICSRLEEVHLPNNCFDLITMWDVFEHVSRPDPVLKRCHALLREGGSIFMRTPNISIQLFRARLIRLLRGMQPGVAYLQARDHAHHYSMSSIQRLLQRNGFSHIEFLHLHPIQSFSGGKGELLSGVKNVWFEFVRAIAIVSRGHVNFDNLFVVAQKSTSPDTPR
jgi:2-polyprenyl-3-methyl-5-hydroxy-6-metoxy-1,4-benzoquinol methylase